MNFAGLGIRSNGWIGLGIQQILDFSSHEAFPKAADLYRPGINNLFGQAA